MYRKLPRVFVRNMSHSAVIRLINDAETVDKRLAELTSKLEEVRNIVVEGKIRELTKENEVLIARVEKARNELIRLETLNGKKQYAISGRTTVVANAPEVLNQDAVQEKLLANKQKKEKDTKKSKEKPSSTATGGDIVVDVRKLDFKIGKIIEINKHPDADSLYVERIDCGEEKSRTVVSGLVNHVPIDEMRDRMVMVLCNLKPVKMRGITSEAMVMCASSPDKVEVLLPPSGAIPGDVVSCEGYPREPDAQLNPKKKIFETCAPDLKTNDHKIACYKNSPLVIPGKGAVTAPTLKGVSIK